MNLEEYKKLMKVSEAPTECAEAGELQICTLTQINPIIDLHTGCKIAFDVMHGTLLLLNPKNEILQLYLDKFDYSPEDDELIDCLKALQ